jgi:ubiquinone/menaquinone biosynthesis C-methylase UbiE
MKSYKAIAAYYDAEYAHHGMLQRDVPMLINHLPKKRQSILELATGTGRAAIPLAQAGHRVVGVDYDPAMLAIAKRKRDSVGITEKNLSLIQADVLNLDLKTKFDCIAIFFNTFLAFTTLDQQDAVLQGVYKHLKPNGFFWLDIFQPNLALLAQPLSVDLDPTIFYVPELDRTVFRNTTVRRDPATQQQAITFDYQWFDPRGLPHRRQVKFNLTFIFPRELQLLLERNGLEIETLFGDHNASPLDADSPRIIALCRKK